MFTYKNGNIIDDNIPDENEEGKNPEITGVSTGVGNTETTPYSNTLEITNNNTQEMANNNTQDTQEMANNNNILNNSKDTFDVQEAYTTHADVQEVHTTHEDKEEPHKEPTIHNKQIVEEMHVTNM